MKKILYGICGIGNGHFFRQLPIIDFLLSQNHHILFFAYGESLNLLARYNNNPLVKIVEVSVPYFIGNSEGVDFVKSEKINAQFDYSINLRAFAIAQKWLGSPDLVITDYEPVSAQYGYAYGTQVITIDQQSKFFSRNTPSEINGFNCEDEIMRLSMFFPLAKRFACSFFKIKQTQLYSNKIYENQHVTIVPPIYRKNIQNMKRTPIKNQFLIYLSAQSGFKQNLADILTVLNNRKFKLIDHETNEEFHIFSREDVSTEALDAAKDNNIFIHTHGSLEFEKILTTCSGVITTAGHNLLGECMFLNIPVYAMPMDLYEQQLNAKMVGDYWYGLNYPMLSEEKLEEFIKNNSFYVENIRHSEVLFKESGEKKLLQAIQDFLK